jgi:AcrR family transcriptional regulator
MESRAKRGNAEVGGHAVRRPRGRPKSTSDDAKRTQIIAAAQKTFQELGYGRTTMDLVAARCKVSKQTLYQLFSSKIELFAEIIAAHRETMLALPRDPDEQIPLAETLADIFMIDIEEDAELERRAFINAVMLDVQQFPEIGEAVRTHGIEQSRQMLADWLAGQRARGNIVIDDTLSGARMLMDMIFGAMVSPPGQADDWPSREVRSNHLRRCIDVFLHGVCPTDRRAAV